MPIPKPEPVGAVAAASSPTGHEFRISGIQLDCLTCGDGGLAVATWGGHWVISCRNGHDYEPTPDLPIITISPEDEGP